MGHLKPTEPWVSTAHLSGESLPTCSTWNARKARLQKNKLWCLWIYKDQEELFTCGWVCRWMPKLHSSTPSYLLALGSLSGRCSCRTTWSQTSLWRDTLNFPLFTKFLCRTASSQSLQKSSTPVASPHQKCLDCPIHFGPLSTSCSQGFIKILNVCKNYFTEEQGATL